MRSSDLRGRTGLLVEVELEVLVVPEEAASLLVNREAVEVLLVEQQTVLALRDLHLQFRRLLVDARQTNRVRERPVA